MATTSTPSLRIAAAVLILMCIGAAAQAPAPSPSKRMAPGPSSYAGKAPEPSSSYAGKAPEPSSSDAGMAPEPMAPSPAGDQCFTYVLNMSDCLSYVQDGSKQTVPDKPCCPELAGLLDSHPLCLCELVGSAGTYGVNVSKALTLPGACNIAAPALTLCPGFAGPPEPAGSPPEPSQGPAAGGGSSSIAEPPKALATSTMADSSLAFLLASASSVLIALF